MRTDIAPFRVQKNAASLKPDKTATATPPSIAFRVLPDALRSAKSVGQLESRLQKLATLRLPDGYVEPFRKDVVEYMAKKMGVSTDINGTLLPGRTMTAADARVIQSYLEKVQTIGPTSSNFKVVLETARELAVKRKQ